MVDRELGDRRDGSTGAAHDHEATLQGSPGPKTDDLSQIATHFPVRRIPLPPGTAPHGLPLRLQEGLRHVHLTPGIGPDPLPQRFNGMPGNPDRGSSARFDPSPAGVDLVSILIDGIPDIIPKSSTQMVERLIGQLTTCARRLRKHGLPLIGLRLCALDRACGYRQDGVIRVLSLGGRSSDRCFHELNQFRWRSRNPSGEFIKDRLVALMTHPDQYRHRRQTQRSGDFEIIEPM